MRMNNLIKYSDIYYKMYGSLWQYCKDIPAVDDYVNSFDFNRVTYSFSFTQK